jgi:serine/threonine-protein kinase
MNKIFENKKVLIPAIIVVIIALLILSIFLFGRNSGKKNTDNDTLVAPSLIGLDYEEAVSSYPQLSIAVDIDTPLFDDHRNIIYEQSIAAGEKIYKSLVITVKVKLESDLAAVPDVRGMRAADAEKILTEAGFAYTEIFELSETIDKDYVIKTSPAKGETVPVDTVIEVSVSMGSTETQIVMPNLIGGTLEEARVEAGIAKIVLEEVYIESDAPVDRVLTQSVPEGNFVQLNEKVKVEISNGIHPLRTVDITINLPTNTTYQGTYRLDFKIGDELIGSTELFKTEYTDITTVSLQNRGVQNVTVELVNLDYAVTAIVGVFKVDFVAKTYDNPSAAVIRAFSEIWAVISGWKPADTRPPEPVTDGRIIVITTTPLAPAFTTTPTPTS